MHRPVLVTAPVTAPVTLAEAKAHLRADFDDDDNLITALIDAATEHLNGWTGTLGCCLMPQTWRQDFERLERCLSLPLRPVNSITAVTWRNTVGQIATISSDEYSLKTDAGGRSYIRFRDGYDLPTDLYQSAAVSVTYAAGYDAVPAPIKQAILLLVGSWYENREDVIVGATVAPLPETLAVKALLSPFRAGLL